MAVEQLVRTCVASSCIADFAIARANYAAHHAIYNVLLLQVMFPGCDPDDELSGDKQRAAHM